MSLQKRYGVLPSEFRKTEFSKRIRNSHKQANFLVVRAKKGCYNVHIEHGGSKRAGCRTMKEDLYEDTGNNGPLFPQIWKDTSLL